MKPPLWSKILGVIIGILVGAGTTYAAVKVYEYKVEVPAKVKVESNVISPPGLEVAPNPLDFGSVGLDDCSKEVHIFLHNYGNKDLDLLHRYTIGLPKDVSLEASYNGKEWMDFEGYVPADTDGVLEAEETTELYLRLQTSGYTATGLLKFSIGFEEKEIKEKAG